MGNELKGIVMKSPIKIIEEFVDKYPNDMELGGKVRAYINWLRGLLKENPNDED
tara:strand:- start:1240 stop:1401 length:162 start_codon:yes stop_codon:yes gene_type:complete